MRHLAGHTKNGIPVYIDLINSQAAPHIAAQPHLLGLAGKALGNVTATGPRHKFEHDLKRTIGYENVVKTPADEKVLYAQLINDPLYSRFTRKGDPASTTYVSITLEREDSGSYALVDTWIGRLKPPRPGSENETAASRDYWANHAFLLDTQVMQRHTRTEVCPY